MLEAQEAQRKATTAELALKQTGRRAGGQTKAEAAEKQRQADLLSQKGGRTQSLS